MCSEHFTEEDYTNRIADYLVRRLKRDEIGVCVFPSKHARCVSSHQAADKPESERSKRKVRYFSASVSLPVIFCSLTLAKTSVFSCKCSNCDAVFIRETERCNGKFSASTSADQSKPKRLLHCCPYKTEPEQAVDRRFWSRGSQQRCKFVSKGRPYSMAAFLNMRIRELIQ